MHENERLVRTLFGAFDANDVPTIDALLDDGIVWHAPGRGTQAGRREGKPALFAAMGQLAELTGGTLRGDIHDVLASDEHVVVLQTTRARRDERALEDPEVLVLHVSDGRITEVWEHPGDLHAMDAFFG